MALDMVINETAARTLEMSYVQPSKTNPRRGPGDLAELTESIGKHGVLQPILVRPIASLTDEPRFEIVAGHRRFAAASGAGLNEIPALVRELDDQAALEIQVIENLDRSDLHALEEAHGYERLITLHKYDVARIAARIGRSVQYVYDRVKLLKLIKPLQELFLEDKITAGHAIVLARLKSDDQKRLLDPSCDGLFQGEYLLWNPDENTSEAKGPFEGVKARSVRELQAWVDENVRFDAKAADPVLFPETVAAVTDAPKVIPITHSHQIRPEAREGRTYGPKAWERADGLKGSKTCEHSVIGFIAIGPGRGQSFAVCTAKEKCPTHWRTWQRERNKRKDAPVSGGRAGQLGKAPAVADVARRAHQTAVDQALADANEQVVSEVVAQAATLSGVKFLRALSTLDPWTVREYLHAVLKLKNVHGKGVCEKWIKRASEGQLQAALIYNAAREAYGAEADAAMTAMGVKVKEIRAATKKAALEKLKATKAAKPKARKATPKRSPKKK